MLEILTRAFYAQQDTRTPVLVGAAAMGINIVLSFALSGLFGRLGWFPHGGLALANSIATALEMLVLYALMRRRLRSMEDRRIGLALGVAAAGACTMGLALLAWVRMPAPSWLTAGGGVLLGGACYVAVMRLLQVPELSLLYQGVLRRLSRNS
jgi:putative peptidoglycan lipid II flippase